MDKRIGRKERISHSTTQHKRFRARWLAVRARGSERSCALTAAKRCVSEANSCITSSCFVSE
jgi:hypothetical protein